MIPLLTRRGLLFLTIGGAGLLIPIITTLPPWLGLFICCFACIAFLVFGARDYLHARRFFHSIRAELSGPARVWFGMRSSMVLQTTFSPLSRAADLEINPAQPLGFDVNESTALELSKDQRTFGHPIQFIPYRRGEQSWELIWMRFFPLQGMLFFQKRVRCSGNTGLCVVPNPRAATDSEELAAQKQFQVGSHRYLAGLRGREFDGLRRYQSGDDIRHVDWKRSARGTGLVVKTYRPETHQRITVAIDCGRRMSSRLGNILQLDAAIDATARLVRTAVNNSDEIGCFAFSDVVQASVRVSKGVRHEEIVLKALQDLESSLVESDYTLLSDWIGTLRRRSLLVLITSFSSAKSFESIRWVIEPVKTRHLVLIVVIADRELKSLATTAAETVEDAYSIAAANEQLAELNRQMAMMRSLGFECMYADADDLGRELHQAYLRCKESGKL